MPTGNAAEPIVIELTPMPDVFCMGIAKIEIIGPCARFSLFCDQTPCGGGPVERHIVAKFVLPLEAIPECIRQAVEATASHTVGVIAGKISSALHLH